MYPVTYVSKSMTSSFLDNVAVRYSSLPSSILSQTRPIFRFHFALTGVKRRL